jgi:hypothetical protein
MENSKTKIVAGKLKFPLKFQKWPFQKTIGDRKGEGLWVETWVGNLEGEVGIRSLKKYKKEIIS